MADRKRVLFLCTGNSCRSQMAEGLVAAQHADQWEAFSAGTEPEGYVNPHALTVLREIGIEHSGESKSVDHFQGQAFDLVITVCDDAAENCPVWLGQGRTVHVGFPDPAKARGSDEEVMQVYREVLAGIQERIPPVLEAHAG